MAILDDKQFTALIDLIRITIDDAIDKKQLVTKKDIDHLPTKDEFYEQTAEILKRLDDIEESNTLLVERVSKNSDAIEKLKKIHPSYRHH